MPNLISPGVSVEIVNESYYDSSSPGSVPLIIIATATNKVSPSGSGIAPMTTTANVNRMFLATSQRELIQNYGNPIFYSSGGTQLHGHELNEYGLHAAYQFLGVSNRCFIIRADIDSSELFPSDTAPAGAPAGGTFWLDTSATSFGVFQSNGGAVPGSAWVSKSVRIAYAADTTLALSVHVPKTTFGSNGDFAVAVEDTNNFLFEKIAGAWHRVGSAAWKAAKPTIARSVANPTVVSGDTFTINGSTVTLTGTDATAVVADILAAAITNVDADVDAGAVVITNTAGGNLVFGIGTGTPLTALGIPAGTVKGVSLTMTNDIQYPTGSVMGDVWVKGYPTNKGADWSVNRFDGITGTWSKKAAPLYPFDSTLADGQTGKDTAALAALAPVEGQIYIGYDNATGVMQPRRMGALNFEGLVYEASASAPTGQTLEGALWYSNDFRVDMMVSDGMNWKGYQNYYPNTDPEGVLISGSAPVTQSDNTALVDNDLWIDSTDLEHYPKLYRYDASAETWRAVDLTDQTSPFGILFADVRQDSGLAFTGMDNPGAYTYESTEIQDLLISDCVDPDAPDPRTVPAGMLIFNTRFSTYNVKQWKSGWFDIGGYDANTNYGAEAYTVGDDSFGFAALSDTGRWVTVSGNRSNGSPLMGRRAQRAMITKAMAEAIITNQDARSEIINFNLIAAPGYPELVDELVALNTEQRETAFIIGDTPIRLSTRSQDIMDWATNTYGGNGFSEDGMGPIDMDGITVANEYVGIYYPWGLSTNIDGAEVMVPPSTMALRTFAYSDQISYPWFAPAGFTRGIVTNASAVGYLDSENEFRPVLLNQSTRDLLYSHRINPIAYIQNRGLVVFGQKTMAPVSSALDRVNVARLVNYLNVALDTLAKPFLFTQNDDQTRAGFKSALERYLSSLAGLRAIDDFAVQCDRENNSKERVARNELWADVMILPVKAVEYIYIPIRLTVGIDE